MAFDIEEYARTSRRKARRVTRFALDRAWGIVGSTNMPLVEVRHMLTYLYGGPDGLAAARRIAD